jgi:hypothetical protein
MGLSELRKYLQTMQKIPVTLSDIVQYFSTSADRIEPMLAFWVAKGYLEKTPKKPACGTRCQACDPLSVMLYQWVGS